MPVGCINNNCINPGLNQRVHTLECIGGNPNACCNAQMPLCILTGMWFIPCHRDTFTSKHTKKAPLVVDNREPLYLTLLEKLGHPINIGALADSS